MATGTFYLRPSADVLLEHSSSLTEGGYLAINEEVADGDATKIINIRDYDTPDSSIFKLAGIVPNEKIKIIDIKVCVNALIWAENGASGGSSSVSIDVMLSVNGTTIDPYTICNLHSQINSNVNTPYTLYESVNFDNENILKNTINNYLLSSEYKNLPDIELTITTTVKAAQDDKGRGKAGVYITQAYVVCSFDTNFGLSIHKKVNGSWLQAQAAYQKQNGTWVEITEDACKEILQNNLLNSGNA